MTPAQTAALAAYAQTGSRKIAAHRLGISEGALRTRLERAYRHLGLAPDATDRGQAFEALRRLGWLRVPRAA